MAKFVLFPEDVTAFLHEIDRAADMARSSADVNSLATLLRLKFDVIQAEFDIDLSAKEKAP